MDVFWGEGYRAEVVCAETKAGGGGGPQYFYSPPAWSGECDMYGVGTTRRTGGLKSIPDQPYYMSNPT